MNLVVPSFSLMCMFLLAFRPSSAQSLVLSALWGLKPACLGISRGAVATLQEFLRRGKKKGQTNLIPISGRVPVLNLEFAHGRSVFQPAVENLLKSDSVKRHLRGRHLSALNLKFDFISDGGCTREEQIAHSLKRHLFPHGGREPKAFWICFSRVHPPSEIKSSFNSKH